MCPYLGHLSDLQDQDGYVDRILTPRYRFFLTKFAEARGDVKNPHEYKASEMLHWNDAIHAHWYDRRPTPEFSDEMVWQMQEVDKDDSNHELIGIDKITTKAYTTGMTE